MDARKACKKCRKIQTINAGGICTVCLDKPKPAHERWKCCSVPIGPGDWKPIHVIAYGRGLVGE